MLFKINFAFVQIERTQIDSVRNAVVQAALVLFKFFFHPTGGTTTRDEHDIVAILYPISPEVLQLVYKFTSFCVHPRHLVKEEYLPLVCAITEILGQLLKCLMPVAELRNILITRKAFQSLFEILELYLLFLFVCPHIVKTVGVTKETAHKKCFPHTSAPIQNDQFRPLGFQSPFQLLTFPFASNQLFHISIIKTRRQRYTFCEISEYENIQI